jgi:hypothetical protein
MDFIHGLVALQSARMHGNGMKKLSRSRALELVWIVWIDHGVVAGAKVAGFLPGPRWHAAALVAADVAHLVAHLVVPVVAAANGAAGRAVCTQRETETGMNEMRLLQPVCVMHSTVVQYLVLAAEAGIWPCCSSPSSSAAGAAPAWTHGLIIQKSGDLMLLLLQSS